jgi:type IV secretion system protein TrbL
MKSRHLLVAVFLLVAAQVALAQAQALGANDVLGIIKQAMAPAINKLTSQAISWLGVFAALQFFITNYNLLKTDGDIQSVIAKMFAAVGWIGVVLYIINHGPQFIQAVGDQMFGVVGLDLPSPGNIIGKTIGVSATVSVLALGVGSIPFVGNTAGQLLLYVALAVLAVGMYFAFKIFMLQLELGLIAMLSPLSFSFLGLNTLKDQGIAPFKGLLSLTYRIILMTVILAAFNQVSDIVSGKLSEINVDTFKSSGIGEVADIMLSALASYMLLAYLTFKSDAIAATLAGGATSMGAGDVAQAAAAGAAVGAAVATAGGSLAGTAGKAPTAMSSFMDKLMGRGSVSNASSMGSGGEAPSFTPPASPSTASPSLSVGAPVSGGAPGSSSPGSAQSGAGPSPAKANVASGRYGADLADVEQVQRDAQNDPSAEQSAGADEAAGAGAAAADPVTVTPASEKGEALAGAPDVPGAGQRAAIGEAAGADAAANDGVTVTPAGSQGKAADATKAVPGASSMPANSKSDGVAGAPGVSGARKPAGSKGAGGEATKAVPEAGQQTTDPGSALSAGIGGKPSLEKDLSRLVDHLTQQGPRKPTLGERLGDANKHLAQEQAATHVSINAHHTD